MRKDIIQFRQKDYKRINNLGRGATGEVILMYDETINEHFVCKKYSPCDYIEDPREFYDNFVNEIKFLHLLYHKNIVRVFNYYLYPENNTGYMLMEYIEGENISLYIKDNPNEIDILFEQIVSAFNYIHSNNILHRDIRSNNILITKDGLLKVIDFGFGKKIDFPEDIYNSLKSKLNWTASYPDEFTTRQYNFKTEIYFIGQLFNEIIITNNLTNFKYNDVLSKMTNKNPDLRPQSFQEIELKLNSKSLEASLLDENQILVYRNFATTLKNIIANVKTNTIYRKDIQEIIRDLGECYKNNILEENINDNSSIIDCFIKGSYSFSREQEFSVSALKKFIELLKSSTAENREIILKNLYGKLNTIKREYDDDLPF